MKDLKIKQLYPYIGVVLFFLILSLGYFYPQIQGKVLASHDNKQWKGGAKEIIDFREATGEEPLWSNSMFGGMPAYYVSVRYPSNKVHTTVTPILTIGLTRPALYVFWSLVGFFILMISLKVPWPIAIIGSIGFAFGSYNFVIMAAGHYAKVVAIAFLPGIFAGLVLLRKRKYLLGMAVAALFMSLEIGARHPQMTYYFFIFFLVVYFVFAFVQDFRQGKLKDFLISSALFGVAVFLGVLPNASQLMATQEYVPYSTRGKSELTIADQKDQTGGLDKSYITAWSNGIGETWSLLIPNAKGGASGRISENKTAMKAVDRKYRTTMEGVDAYWGDQPMTSGPMYAGAIIMFLFVLGLFLVDGPLKWTILISSVIVTMLSWGSNFMGLTEFFIDNFPYYNKFRAVASIEIVALFAIPLLAGLALKKVWDTPEVWGQPLRLLGKETKYKKSMALFASFGLTGGLALLFWLMPEVFFDFFKSGEAERYRATLAENNWSRVDVQDLLDNITAARKAVFKMDAIRSAAFVIFAFGLLFFSWRKSLSIQNAVFGIAALVLIDMAVINLRYLNEDNFDTARKVEAPFPKTVANEAILADQSPGYRVLNLAASTFNETGTSYYHHSIGGYNGAKMKKYQELIDFYIAEEMQTFMGGLRNAQSFADVQPQLLNWNVLNALNTKYIIYSPDQNPIVNNYAFGPAWYVSKVEWVGSADEEMTKLAEVRLNKTAVIREDQRDMISVEATEDSLASIQLVDYQPNKLVYKSKSSKPGVVSFSEIWYPEGWKAYIDGEERPIARANYTFRAMSVPAGEHEIVFEFKPQTYYTAETVSLIGSILVILVFIGGIGWSIRNKMS
jgi:hypothetical protein